MAGRSTPAARRQPGFLEALSVVAARKLRRRCCRSRQLCHALHLPHSPAGVRGGPGCQHRTCLLLSAGMAQLRYLCNGCWMGEALNRHGSAHFGVRILAACSVQSVNPKENLPCRNNPRG